jgi:C-terminal processing protease CtpA/Prc
LTEVVYLSGAGKVSTKLEGLPRDRFSDFIYGTGNTRQLHLYKDLSLAVVEIRSYNNLQRSKEFIDSAFKVIRQNGIQHVALDLRKNGGGNSFIGDYFLGYINRKPYRTIASKTWRLGPIITSLPEDHWMQNSLNNAKKQWTVKDAMLQSPVFDVQQPVQVNDTNYYSKAKLYLLTSARTYSSAHMTAMAVKCGNLGLIIGQPTGERLDLTGEILEKALPSTKLNIVIPSASYISSCGNGKQVGVAPDHYVPISAADLKQNRDPELEYLKVLIRAEK